MKAMVVRAPGGTDVLRMETIAGSGAGAEGCRHQGRCLRRLLPRYRHAQRHAESRRADAVHPRPRDFRHRGRHRRATCAAFARATASRPCSAITSAARAGIAAWGARRCAPSASSPAMPAWSAAMPNTSRSRTTTWRWCRKASRCRTPRSSPARSAPSSTRSARSAGSPPGESALVTGAGGGLGMHAVQLARLAGARLSSRRPPRRRRPSRSARSARMR